MVTAEPEKHLFGPSVISAVIMKSDFIRQFQIPRPDLRQQGQKLCRPEQTRGGQNWQ
jgi:hypothetical protein